MNFEYTQPLLPSHPFPLLQTLFFLINLPLYLCFYLLPLLVSILPSLIFSLASFIIVQFLPGSHSHVCL